MLISAGGEKASSFAIFSIANVLAFVRWLGIHYATFVLSNLTACATLVIVWVYGLLKLEHGLMPLAHILFGCELDCYGLLYGLF